jgi:hypothetical protein
LIVADDPKAAANATTVFAATEPTPVLAVFELFELPPGHPLVNAIDIVSP